jgi:hypothetical protein
MTSTEDPFRRPTFGSAVFYKDPLAALGWLAHAEQSGDSHNRALDQVVTLTR